MIYVGQFPDDDRISTIRAHVLSQVVPRRAVETTTAVLRRAALGAARERVDRAIHDWFGHDPPVLTASTGLDDTDGLLRHAARLQNLDSDLALLFGRWRHLPYWIESIWVPMDEDIRPFLFDRVAEGPFFIGSAKALIGELDEIALQSAWRVPHLFVRGGLAEAQDHKEAGLQEVWNQYRQAAVLALETGLPMWTAL